MDSFDFYFYTQYYEDLKFFNKQGAMLHFLKHGQKEQRMSNMEEFINFLQTENFDSNFYQKLYGLNFNKGQYNHLLSYLEYIKKFDKYMNNYALKTCSQCSET